MDTHDLTAGDAGPETSNTHDLPTRMTGAEDQSILNLNVSHLERSF